MSVETQGNAPRVISSIFHQRYQLILPNGAKAHATATRVDTSCIESVERLIRVDFASSDSLWRSILREYFADIVGVAASGVDLYRVIAKLTTQGRIQFYKLPQLQKSMLAKDGRGKALRFIKGPDPSPAEDTAPIKFVDDKTIDNALNKVKVEDAFWGSVLEESGTKPRGKYVPPGGNKAIVKQQLKSGELRAYEIPYTPAAPKSVMEFIPEPLPTAQPVPLAPPTPPGWIEIKLMYEDDEPIANQDYWIKDSDGNEYTGTTDDEGMAKVQDVTDGYCDIKFPELDGWYQ